MTPARGLRSVMEGGGAYNANSAMQASAAAIALPLIEKAAGEIPVSANSRPIVIADYGSSEGKNSLAPMRAAIRVLRRRLGAKQPILVIHGDLPANDFSTLFETAENSAGSYARGDDSVFIAATGRSFYGNVLPPSFVSLGWSAFAAVWLSRIPDRLPDRMHLFQDTADDIRAAFAEQAKDDWETFLRQRSKELRHGGRLVIVLPAAYEDGSHPFTAFFECADSVLSDMAASGGITAAERRRMVIPGYPRSPEEVRAPFAAGGTFAGLALESCTFSEVADTAWIQYERDGDIAALAARRAAFFRATFAPALAAALMRGQGTEARKAFAKTLEAKLKPRLMALKVPFPQYVAMASFAKA